MDKKQVNIISVKTLSSIIDMENLIVLDASFKTTVSGNKALYDNVYIPKAIFFDLKGVFSDTNSPYPNMFPSREKFDQGCRDIGINQDSKIVVYDKFGMYSSARVWWMFKIMGHENVCVLDGGLPEWIEQGYRIEEGYNLDRVYGNFKSKPQKKKSILLFSDIQRNSVENWAQVIDARSEDRFLGIKKEPREGMKSGHISGALNIHYKKMFHRNVFKNKEELEEIFNVILKDPRPVILTCGSGVTACILFLALEEYFSKSKYIYDGSWSEYGKKI